MEARRRLETLPAQSTPSSVAGSEVLEVITTDGIKLKWADLVDAAFSGTNRCCGSTVRGRSRSGERGARLARQFAKRA